MVLTPVFGFASLHPWGIIGFAGHGALVTEPPTRGKCCHHRYKDYEKEAQKKVFFGFHLTYTLQNKVCY